MNRTRTLVIAASAAAAVVFGGVAFGINALAKSPAANVLVATSPSPPTFKSNEDPTHEKSESAAREAAENNGTFHPGPGGPGGGKSNEDPTHEKGESAAREAAENR